MPKSLEARIFIPRGQGIWTKAVTYQHKTSFNYLYFNFKININFIFHSIINMSLSLPCYIICPLHSTQNSVSESYPWFLLLPIYFLKVSCLIESMYAICLSADEFYNNICSQSPCHKAYSHISSFLLTTTLGYLTGILNKIFTGKNS